MIKLLIYMLLLLPSVGFAATLPIEHFVKHGDYLDMTLSPDGKHISARVRINGKVSLIFLDTQTMKVVGGVNPRDNDEIHSAKWISNERVVYQFQESTIYSDKPISTGELFGINIDSSSNKFLYGFRAAQSTIGTRVEKRKGTYATPEIISALEGDDRNILIMEHPWSNDGFRYYDDRQYNTIISRLNVFTGKKTKIEVLPHPGATAFADGKGNIRFMTWSDEQSFFHSAYRDTPEGEWKELTQAEDSMQDMVVTGINKQGDKAFVWGTVGDNELYTLFEFDLKTAEYTQLFSGMSTDIEDIINDPLTGEPVVAVSYPAKADYHYRTDGVISETASLHKALLGSFGGQTTVFASTSENGELILVHVHSDVNPGEYYLFNAKTKNAQFLWANRSWLDPRKMLPTKAFQFTSSDGLPVHGYITLPKAVNDTPPPLVVMIHGGPQSRDFPSFDGEVQLLANQGYAVMQVNFRGSAGYGKKFLRAGYRQWGGTMIQDIIEGTQYASKQFKIDGNNICTYGASYGGYAALMATVRAPDMFKCAIGYVGIYDLNYAFSESDTMRFLGGEAYLERVLGTDKAVLDEFSPVNHAQKIKANIMLIHGDKDTRVPVINAEKMLQRLSDTGKQVPYLNFSKSGHGVYDEQGRLTLYSAVLKHLKENIGQ